MKMTKLLTGAAAIALLTGAAQAQTTYNQQPVLMDGSSLPGSTETVFLAEELDLVTAARTTVLTIELTDADDGTADEDWGSGAANLRIDLEGFLFNASVLDGDIGEGEITDNCTATVIEGGTPGDDFVVFQIEAIEDCEDAGGDSGVIVSGLDVIYQGPTGNFTTTLTRTSTGVAIEGGAVEYEGDTVTGTTSNYGLVDSRSAVTATVDKVNPVASIASEYAALDGYSVGTIAVADTASTFLDFEGNTVGGAYTVDLDVTLEDLTGLDIDETFLDAGADIAGTASDSTVEFEDLVATTTYAVTLVADADNPGAIKEQTITGALDVDFTATLLSDIASDVIFGSISREGESVGPFEWVSGEGGITTSVFRLTGFDADEAIPTIRVSLDNMENELDEDEFILDTSDMELSSGGELVVTSETIGAQAGDYGRADVSFFFETSGIEVRRLLASASGTLSTFEGDFQAVCSGSMTSGAIDPTGVTGTLDVASSSGGAATGDTIAYTGTATQADGTVSISCEQ